jgi:hypothetical protein
MYWLCRLLMTHRWIHEGPDYRFCPNCGRTELRGRELR